MRLIDFMETFPDEVFFSMEVSAKEKDKYLKRGKGSQKKSRCSSSMISNLKRLMKKSYTNFNKIVKEHIHQVIELKQVGKVLPWVHIAIANAKRQLLDVYHNIRPEYLQNYLNEFCWKFNRRNFGDALFDRLMVAAVSYKNITLSEHVVH